MSGQDMIQSMTTLHHLLDMALKEFRVRGENYAKKEHDYRIAKAEKILNLRADGIPATVTLDIAKGDRDVAQLCMERDIAEVLYKSSEEAINSYKLQIRVLSDEIKREWSKQD